jgi:hypothetical protein
MSKGCTDILCTSNRKMAVHTVKPTNAIYFVHTICHNATCFDLSWSSSGSNRVSVQHVYKNYTFIILTLVHLLVLVCELFINARTLITLSVVMPYRQMIYTSINTQRTCYIQPTPAIGLLKCAESHLCFCICFTDVQQLPEDDQDRWKQFGVMTNSVWKFVFMIRAAAWDKTAGIFVHSVKCKTKDSKNERHIELLEALNTNKRQKCTIKC